MHKKDRGLYQLLENKSSNKRESWKHIIKEDIASDFLFSKNGCAVAYRLHNNMEVTDVSARGK